MSLTDVALDVQVELLRHVHSNVGCRYVQAEADEAFEGTGHGHINAPLVHQRILREGATFAVTEDIVDFLDMARKGIPSWTLHASDLPSPAGFVWFEKPIMLEDDTPERKSIVEAGFGWITLTDSRGHHGVILVSFTLPLDQRDHAYTQFVAERPLYEAAHEAGLTPPRNIWSMTSGIWPFDNERPDGGNDTFRLFATFLRFIGEPWVDADDHDRPSRPAGRRAARERVDPLVKVVRLRRKAKTDTAAQNGSEPPLPKREYVHRWMVGLPDGRWRNQWYPSEGVHRPKWIAPYPKGPAGAPWLTHEIVYQVDR